MTKPIHPFPARMAPDLAFGALADIEGGVVLDPMVGSGTVVRQASELGFTAKAFDMDPLAILMTRVWTTPVDDSAVEDIWHQILVQAATLHIDEADLPWIRNDPETRAFIEYWFGPDQRRDIARIACALYGFDADLTSTTTQAALDVLRIALSRIIITKDSGASLARDVSHSRPHKVKSHSNFDVMSAFDRSVIRVRKLISSSPPPGNVSVALGDSRSLDVANRSVDAVVTSPPYLNAIDYMRGHRLSLVWLGYRLSDLRKIRSDSIGAERGLHGSSFEHMLDDIGRAMGSIDQLPNRQLMMIRRYIVDIYRLMSEISRVLKSGGRATLVVGNSCIKGVFVRNSDGFIRAGEMVGLRLVNSIERELPVNRRYLPITPSSEDALGRRMRTETVLTFAS